MLQIVAFTYSWVQIKTKNKAKMRLLSLIKDKDTLESNHNNRYVSKRVFQKDVLGHLLIDLITLKKQNFTVQKATLTYVT